MAEANIFNILYSQSRTPFDFDFDKLWKPSMYNYLYPGDIEQLYKIATSIQYSSKMRKKYKAIDNIMKARGFAKLGAGTNRVVYKYLEDQSFVMKIAVDEVGLKDNPREFVNQNLLKPFVTKVFEVSPCGTVAMVERVDPITSRQEFVSISDDIFNLITKKIIGKYVLADIGTKYFMNYGLRKGFGAVLLDFPYVYELDGNKLYCNKPDINTGLPCGGTIDYDEGFNDLICTKCGKTFYAEHLETDNKDKNILIKDEGEIEMKITIKKNGEVDKRFNSFEETDVIVRKQKNKKREESEVKVRVVKLNQQGEPERFNEPKIVQEEKKSIKINLEEPRVIEVPKEEKLIVKSTFIPDVEEAEKPEEKITMEDIEKMKENMCSLHTEEDESLSQFNLSDDDFEEPEDDEEYSDEIDEEPESFEKIAKKKSNLERY